MASQTKPYNILEALYKSSIPNTELVLLVGRCVMTHHNSKTSLRFNLKELLLKPSELIAWIIICTPHIHVQGVAGIGVQGNQSRTSGNRFPIVKLNLHTVVPKFSVLFHSLFI